MNSIKINILLLFASMFCFISCYEGNGNYEYTKINEIEIVGLEDSYEASYLITTVEIDPIITSADKSVEFDYMWGIYPNGAQGYVPELDTLTHTKDLRYFADKPAGSYTLLFRVTEKKTNISYYYQRTLNIVTEFTDGWYVLKDNGTITDLDIFKIKEDEQVSYHNILPNKLMGKAVAVSTSQKYDYIDEDKVKQANKKVFFIQSENDLNVCMVEDLKLLKKYNELFFLATSSIPRQVTFVSGMTFYGFIDESGIYKRNTSSANIGLFGFPMVSEHGQYRIGKYSMRNSRNVVMYDELNCRLLSIPYNGNNLVSFGEKNSDGKDVDFSPNNMNADCLYLSTFEQISETMAFGVFEDRTSKQRSVYKFDATVFATYSNPILSLTPITEGSQMSSASVYALNRGYEMIYYAKDNTIGVYNIQGNSEERDVIVYEPGTEITYVNNAYLRVYNKPDDSWSKLVVATHKDGRYKVYLYDMRAGKPTGTPDILEGEGRPAEVLRVAPDINNQNSGK